MYLRIKRIKGHEYAYLVKNKWTKQGPRQINKKYLGRVLQLPVREDTSFDDVAFVEKYPPKKILQQLFLHELQRYGFQQKSKRYWSFPSSEMTLRASIDSFTLTCDGKEIVLKNDEGYLVSYFFQRILHYVPKREDFEQDALTFSKLVVALGLHLTKDVFVAWFEKIYNQGN